LTAALAALDLRFPVPGQRRIQCNAAFMMSEVPRKIISTAT
jgi:hypothetical protein